MLLVWRLVTARFADSAFSGEGARLYGGRWNPKGVPLVYTSSSQSLALLEMLVQDDPLRARYMVIPATLPDGMAIERVTADELPAAWRELGARERLQDLGAAWAASLSSAVLAVPSVVIPADSNYLLNPLHPAFREIEIGEPRPFFTDLRLFRRLLKNEASAAGPHWAAPCVVLSRARSSATSAPCVLALRVPSAFPRRGVIPQQPLRR